MPISSSLPLNLSTVVSYFGGPSGLTNYYRGGTYVKNPANYNSGTQTSAVANCNSIAESGDLTLTSFLGARKFVDNASLTVDSNNITQSGDNGARYWVGVKTANDFWYRSGYNTNYATIAGEANAGQLLRVNRWGPQEGSASFSIPFTVNVTGDYYVFGTIGGEGNASATLTLTGSGVASGGTSGTSISHDGSLVLNPVLTANTTVTIGMSFNFPSASGGGGDNILAMVRTNCNADNGTIGNNAGNNYSFM